MKLIMQSQKQRGETLNEDRNWRIDATSNFNDESYAESTLESGLTQEEAKKRCDFLNSTIDPDGRTFYQIRHRDAPLWGGISEFV